MMGCNREWGSSYSPMKLEAGNAACYYIGYNRPTRIQQRLEHTIRLQRYQVLDDDIGAKREN